MKKMLPAIFCLLLAVLLGVGLVRGRRESPDTLRIYCPATTSETRGGDALTTVKVDWSEMRPMEIEPQVEEALRLLLGECDAPGFRSAIPTGTKLLSSRLIGSTVQVDFSTAYRQLSGMDLTIADYCVALTLVQIPGVYTVRITVDGEDLAYRDSNVFRAEDVLFTSEEDMVRNLPASLYFPDGDGLVSEERMLTVYEGESSAGAVMEALQAGPTREGLRPLLPQGFQVLTVKVENGVCYLNLSSEVKNLLPESEEEQELLIRGITDSLYSVKGIRRVQILMDGELQHSVGLVDVSDLVKGK